VLQEDRLRADRQDRLAALGEDADVGRGLVDAADVARDRVAGRDNDSEGSIVDDRVADRIEHGPWDGDGDDERGGQPDDPEHDPERDASTDRVGHPGGRRDEERSGDGGQRRADGRQGRDDEERGAARTEPDRRLAPCDDADDRERSGADGDEALDGRHGGRERRAVRQLQAEHRSDEEEVRTVAGGDGTAERGDAVGDVPGVDQAAQRGDCRSRTDHRPRGSR
jgi:hypothetical protein